jgi:uncharacterized membrane protein
MAKTVVGLFDTAADAQSAIQELIDTGWPREDISIIAGNTGKEQSILAGADTTRPAVKEAEKGAVIGGLAGLFLGLSELAVPGVGLVIVGGWLATILLGAGIGAAAGGLVGALVEVGVHHEEASHLAEGVRRGGTLVTVRADDSRMKAAIDILNRHHAVNIRERATQWQQERKNQP